LPLEILIISFKKSFSFIRKKYIFADSILILRTMAVTRLKRKEKKNKTVSKARTTSIKRLTAVPVIKKIDLEELKKQAGA
jgi:hypothetical protein